MKYNLTQYSQTISNTIDGDISLTTDDIINILNNTNVSVLVPASGTSGILVLDCDLGARVHTDEIRYYFDSPAASGTVASGIKFYFKNESFEVYTSLNTYYNDSYYYTTVSGAGAPRYIRVEHTIVSGTGGYLNGFQVLNDDTYVDFGDNGTDTNTNFNLSIENSIIEINELEVFNSGPVKANAKLIIEPQNTVADDILFISDSPNGPWYGVYRDEDKITGPDLWLTGNMNDLYVDSNILKLYPNRTVGTYTTRVVKLDEYQNLTFNIMNYDYPIVGSGIEFFDDFTNGNYAGKWTEITNPQYIEFTDGRLSMREPSTRVSTTQTLEYGEDWLFQCRLYQTGSCNIDMYINDTSGEYLLFRVQTGTITDRRIQLITAAGTKYDWDDDVAVQAFFLQKWTWITIQQNFNTLRFKMWNDGDLEPAWEGIYTMPYSEIANTGKIDFRIRGANLEQTIYLDDIVLIKNYTADISSVGFISSSSSDTTENIEVRSSNSRPIDRESYIWMSGTYSPAYKYTNHNWIVDGSVAEQSADWETWGQTSNYWEYWYDSIRDDEYIVDKPFYTSGSTAVYFRIRRKDGTLYSTTITNTGYTSDCFYSTYKISPDNTGGFWINFFLARGNINSGIYYLRYYNSTMTLIYNRQTDAGQGTFLYDMDTVHNSNGYLWYTDRDISTVFKLNTDGTILASYLATENIRGILALSDGGCWFIQEQSLIRLDSNGQVIDTIELPTSTASYIYSDLHGGFWLQEGEIIHHLRSDGTEYFNITIPNLFHITVINSGVLTKQHDGITTTPPQASYISREHQRVIRTWNYPQNEGGYVGTFDTNRYGARSHTYDDLVDDHASHFPIAIDTGWDNSIWKTVSLRDYNFTNEQYHQIRFTLRAEASWNSPEVYGLWTQRAIEIPNIYPGNYGKFYLKSDVTYLDPQDIGNYTSKIKAHWLLNLE